MILLRMLMSDIHRPSFGGAIFFCALIFSLLARADSGGDDTTQVITPAFTPPKAGSYALMHLMPAPGGPVLDTDGQRHDLDEYTRGKVSLLSFVYSSCNDPSGCPYAYMVFHQLKSRLEKAPHLAGRVRLISLSFDPRRDTPQVMALYAGDNAAAGRPVEWRFLTTASLNELLPLLDDWGQDVYLEKDATTGAWAGTYSHVLKVFLIDARGSVREIYTTAFLLPDMVYNDLLTLLMEDGVRP